MDSLGDRIKRYEETYQYKLTPRSCLFIRLDGKAFHTFTRTCEKPFDQNIIDTMVYAAEQTAAEMQGFKLAYIQSDECTFMLTDFDTLQTQGWFGYELSKILSVSASLFTAHFNKHYFWMYRDDYTPAVFDSRAFIVPKEDAANVFIWRQKDWVRNSVQMLARAHFSHKQLDRKSIPEIHEMLHTKGINWAHLDPQLKNGTFIYSDFSKGHIEVDYTTLNKYLSPDAEITQKESQK